MKKKIPYKTRNWSKYNQSLKDRGNISLWISDDLKNWHATNQSTKRGRPQEYSDTCIKLIALIRELYQLNLRAVEGFMEGLFKLMGINLPVPDYTVICRRMKTLQINFLLKKHTGKIDIIVDSTGLKIYGEGEWKMKIHGKDKRRTWRKLHLSINPADFQIESAELTLANVHDGNVVPELLSGISEIGKFYGDGAYMYQKCLDTVVSKGGIPLVNIRDGTGISKKKSLGLMERDRIIREIWAYGNGGKATWKKKNGFHTRSLVETQMYRLKTIFGDKLKSRNFKNQQTEANIRIFALNKMTSFGMPDSYPVIN